MKLINQFYIIFYYKEKKSNYEININISYKMLISLILIHKVENN